jgi:hypothetical protein
VRSGPRRTAVFAAASLLFSFLSSIAVVTTLDHGTARAAGCPAPGLTGTVVLSGGTCTATFSSQTPGGVNITATQMFEVPAGVSSLSIVVDGASGGPSGLFQFGSGYGDGGQESGTVSVAPNSSITPGSTLTLVVGTEGDTAGLYAGHPCGPLTPAGCGGGWPDGGGASTGGGGGGGGSYVYASGNLIMAAGGGGGNGGGGGDGSNECLNTGPITAPPCGGVGGNGGGAGGGSNGQVGNPYYTGDGAAGSGGGGGGASGGGSGGGIASLLPGCPAGDGVGTVLPSGTFATSGSGPAPSPFSVIVDGGNGEIPGPLAGLPSCLQSGGGGGGGGYYGGGGGGGGWEADGGGGGGSGYASTAVSNSQSGTTIFNSQITISFPIPGAPLVSSLTVPQGPVVGGEPVTILGSGFTGATAVNFVGAGGTTTVTLPTPSTSDSSITVNAPNLSGQMNTVLANTNYTVDVEVVTGTTSLANPPNDSYTAMVPVVTAVNTTVNGNTSGSAAGPVVGGETVTLTGQWFNGADSVSFQPTGSTSFVTAPTVNVSGNGTTATFTAPNATSEYTASGATGDLLTDLIVDIPVQGSAAAVTSSPTAQGANDKFYLVPVAVTDLSDHEAAVVGGTVVEIKGTDLTNGTVVLAPTAGTPSPKGCGSDASVSVTPNGGGTADTLAFTAPDQTDAMLVTDGNVVCDVEVQVPVPELGAGVTVTSQPNPGNPGDTLTYPYPVVNSLSTNNGPLGTNTPIIITGSGLIGVSQVQFVLTSQEGGAPGALPVSSNVTPPSALSNTVSVVTPSGGGLLISGDPTLTTDVEVVIPVLGGGIVPITSKPNPGTPGDTYTFTQANACASLSACNTGTSTGSAPAVASSSSTNGTITLTGTGGAGAVTVGRYSANPVGAPSFTSGGSYFDASVESGSAFTSATLQDCDLGGGTSLQWWNPAANAGQGGWQAVTPITGPTSTTPPCVTATFSSTSSPTLAQLTGTVFVAEVPTTGPTTTTTVPTTTTTVPTTTTTVPTTTTTVPTTTTTVPTTTTTVPTTTTTRPPVSCPGYWRWFWLGDHHVRSWAPAGNMYPCPPPTTTTTVPTTTTTVPTTTTTVPTTTTTVPTTTTTRPPVSCPGYWRWFWLGDHHVRSWAPAGNMYPCPPPTTTTTVPTTTTTVPTTTTTVPTTTTTVPTTTTTRPPVSCPGYWRWFWLGDHHVRSWVPAGNMYPCPPPTTTTTVPTTTTTVPTTTTTVPTTTTTVPTTTTTVPTTTTTVPTTTTTVPTTTTTVPTTTTTRPPVSCPGYWRWFWLGDHHVRSWVPAGNMYPCPPPTTTTTVPTTTTTVPTTTTTVPTTTTTVPTTTTTVPTTTTTSGGSDPPAPIGVPTTTTTTRPWFVHKPG